MSRIVNIGVGYRKDELIAEVIYGIKLSDGRMIRLDVPVSQEMSESAAKDYARVQAENYMVRMFDVEHRTGRFTCCNGMTHYKTAGHRPNCPAYT